MSKRVDEFLKLREQFAEALDRGLEPAEDLYALLNSRLVVLWYGFSPAERAEAYSALGHH